MIFVLFMFPIRLVLSWWEKSIFNRASLESPETEGLSVERNDARLNSDGLYPAVSGPAQPAVLHFPRKVSPDSRRLGYNRTASAESATQPDRWAQKGSAQRIPSPSNGTSNGHQSHQIWHPPPSSYSDADEGIAAGANSNPANSRHDSDEDRDLLARVEEIARQEADEWRRYPPFPSAYPPTPVVTTSAKLPSNPPRFSQPPQDTVLTEISEDESQQDFRGSLLPPRKPLNPSYVGLSDDSLTHPGVQSDHRVNDDMAVDSDSDMGDEEDEFNTTLRTPLPLLGSARSYVRDTVSPTRPISFASSVTSKTTVLTSVEGGSSLRTRSSSESLSSVALSMISSTESSSVVGKKRPLPQNIVNKGQAIDRTATRGSPRKRGTPNPPAHRLSHSRIARVVPRRQTVLYPNKASGDSTSSVGDVDSQKTHNIKRRKIALPPGHVVPQVRHRITRYATPLRRAAQPKRNTITVPSGPTRSSIRLRTGLTTNTPNTAKHANVTRPSSFSDNSSETGTRSREQNAAKTSD